MKAFALAALLLATPAAAQTVSCDGGEAMVRSTLYFGTAIPKGGRVSDRQWQAFLAAEITPRFPEGLTVLDGHGQWLSPTDRKLWREDSKVVTLLHADDARPRQQIRDLIAAYRKTFAQESVLWESEATCAAFVGG